MWSRACSGRGMQHRCVCGGDEGRVRRVRRHAGARHREMPQRCGLVHGMRRHGRGSGMLVQRGCGRMLVVRRRTQLGKDVQRHAMWSRAIPRVRPMRQRTGARRARRWWLQPVRCLLRRCTGGPMLRVRERLASWVARRGWTVRRVPRLSGRRRGRGRRCGCGCGSCHHRFPAGPLQRMCDARSPSGPRWRVVHRVPRRASP